MLRQNRRRTKGFSLLEMIAALTILAIGSVVIFSWLGQTAGHLARFQDQEKISLVRLQAVEYLSTLNPMEVPVGRQSFQTFKLEWQSTLAREIRDSLSPSNGLGLYQIGLYDVKIHVLDRSGRAWFDFTVKLAGYKQVRKAAKSVAF